MRLNRFSIVAVSLLTSISFIACGDSSSSSSDNNLTTEIKEVIDSNISLDAKNDSDNNLSIVKDEITNKGYKIQPYLRVAELDGNWSKVPDIATKIAEYIHNNDESITLKFPTNWVIAGAEGDLASEDILGLPFQVDENRTEKIKVVELCNKKYAKMAVETGNFHSSALPCQVSIHSENDKVYIDILDPEAIFTLFFYDLTDEQKVGLKQVALDVKKEVKDMIYASLENSKITELNQQMGPQYNETQFETLHKQRPFKVINYSNNGKEFSIADLKTISAKIIEKLGDEANPSNVAGLSEGSSWRSARAEGIPIPNSQVVEACSPKYAKMATSLGSQYATSLPCEIAITRKNDDNKTLQISYINPTYMFNIMFGKDALNNLSDSKKVQFEKLPDTVFQDLKLIVSSAINELKNENLELTENIPEFSNSNDTPPSPF